VTAEIIGIQEEAATRVFERFYCVDKARSSAEGRSAHGLPVVKWIAEAHHSASALRAPQNMGQVLHRLISSLKNAGLFTSSVIFILCSCCIHTIRVEYRKAWSGASQKIQIYPIPFLSSAESDIRGKL
jgi:hypothetical protein